MNEANYSLCGLPVRLVSDRPLPPCVALEPFRAAKREKGASATTYRIEWYDDAPPTEGQQVYSCIGYTVWRTARGWRFVYPPQTGTGDSAVLEMPFEGGVNRLFLPSAAYESAMNGRLGLSMLLGQDMLMLQNDRLFLHASFIRWHGQGLLFTGPSGMGKSTQARLWETHRGAEVLNGDRVVCRIGEDVTAFGSPWAGSSDIWRNECAPLRAIVSLRQADENTLTPLHGREALAELMPRMATVPWAAEWHVRAMELAIALVSRVPVWRLSCRPDREAVELVRRSVFDRDEQEDIWT